MRAVRVVMAMVVAFGLSLVPAPSQADGSMSFTGSITVTPGLSWPVVGTSVDGAWSLHGNGVGGSTTGDAGSGYIDLAGALHADVFGNGAFCGVSGGSDGTGEVMFPPRFAVRNFGWLTGGPGGAIVGDGEIHRGGVPVGRIHMEAQAPAPTPVVGTGSCASGTATTFFVVGTVSWTGTVR